MYVCAELVCLKSNIFPEKDKHQLLKPPAVINSYNINFQRPTSKPASQQTSKQKSNCNENCMKPNSNNNHHLYIVILWHLCCWFAFSVWNTIKKLLIRNVVLLTFAIKCKFSWWIFKDTCAVAKHLPYSDRSTSGR